MNGIFSRVLLVLVALVLGTAGTAAAESKPEASVARPAPDLVERMLSRGATVVRPDDRAGARASVPTSVVATTTETATGFDWPAAGIGASVALGAVLALAALRVPRRLRGLARATLLVSALMAGSAGPANADPSCVGTYSSHYAQQGIRDEVAHRYTQGNQPYSFVAQFHGNLAECDAQVHG